MKKLTALIFTLFLTVLSLRAAVLLKDSLNYPYVNGCIEGQGQWYCFYPSSPYLDALVTNDILILNTTNHDSVATPTNGWTSPSEYDYASFTINVSKSPSTVNGGYFCQLQNNNDTNDCCHVFIDTIGTTVPGTYRLGIANYSTSFNSLQPPNNYPMDLSTNVNYTVVILFDNNNDNLTGATLWINPSENDFVSAYNDDFTDIPGVGVGYAYGNDTTSSQPLLDIDVTQIGFSPYANAGISNVIAGTTFGDVNTTNLPVWGIQPQSQTNYSGNSATFYAVASGVDVTYQWYSATYGVLSDGPNYVGSSSNTLVVNNLSASDSYHCIATDAYGNFIPTSDALDTVITTPTAPFFPASVVAENLTNNLFTSTGFTNIALGTGPLYYQWYFEPTNLPLTYGQLAGQTNGILSISQLAYAQAGNYYVVVSNSIDGGSIAYGPTNSITVIAPVIATLPQLHTLMIALTNSIIQNESGTVNINTNNVTVAGYVTTYRGFGSSSYTEYFIEDNGSGIEVYLYGYNNTNTPPVGTYVIVSGPVVVYQTTLEIEPATQSSITPTNAPVQTLAPVLANSIFGQLVTNGFGTNAIQSQCSLLTFTNVYIYGSKTGGALGTGGSHSGVGGVFDGGSYNILYVTIGQYGPNNTNTMEIFQPCYNYGTNTTSLTFTNPFTGVTIPTNCYQLTGAYDEYEGTPEIEPSRIQDYVTNPPSSFTAGVVLTNHVPTIKWPVQTGSTYSVYSTTNLDDPWTQVAYGLAYYPTNGTFTDTNRASAKFYQISSP
jgi:hypothetical protein